MPKEANRKRKHQITLLESDAVDLEKVENLDQYQTVTNGRDTNYYAEWTSGECPNIIPNASRITPKFDNELYRDLIHEEFSNPDSMDISPGYQKFIAERLSKAIDRTMKLVTVPENNGRDHHVKKDEGIYLFRSSRSKISIQDILDDELRWKNLKAKKPKLIRKRHFDGSESEDEAFKLKAVAVSADWVINKSNY